MAPSSAWGQQFCSYLTTHRDNNQEQAFISKRHLFKSIRYFRK
jgi:hypothetical protein